MDVSLQAVNNTKKDIFNIRTQDPVEPNSNKPNLTFFVNL